MHALPHQLHMFTACGMRRQTEELHNVRSISQQISKNRLNYEDKTHDNAPGDGLTSDDYESYEEDNDTEDYDWHEDYYEKYKSFARHAMLSEVYQPGFIIENVDLCNIDTTILILINSRLGNSYARDAIRKTFKQIFNNLGITYGFFLSKPANVEARQQVVKESSVWGDLIVATNEEAYPKLTIKTAYLLHWVATNCPNSTYVAKVDDDVYINAARLLSVLNARRNHTILGKVSGTK